MPDHPAPATARLAWRLRLTTGAIVLALAAGCGDADAGALRVGDADSAAPGALPPMVADDVTSEDYRKWLVAQQALDRVPGLELPSRVSLRQFDDADVARVENYLASNEQARAAIEGAGLSVKDYVRTSVALERSMALAQGELSTPTGDTTLLRARTPGDDDSTFQRVWAGRRLRVVETDDDARAGRRWRDDDSDSRRAAKRLEKERKREAKAWAKGRAHGHHGKH